MLAHQSPRSHARTRNPILQLLAQPLHLRGGQFAESAESMRRFIAHRVRGHLVRLLRQCMALSEAAARRAHQLKAPPHLALRRASRPAEPLGCLGYSRAAARLHGKPAVLGTATRLSLCWWRLRRMRAAQHFIGIVGRIAALLTHKETSGCLKDLVTELFLIYL
jgi:hypothetical protein